MKRTITESQLRKTIAESIKNTLNEIGDTEAGQWMLGRLAGRKRLTWDDYDRYHCEDDKNVNPFMNGYELEGGSDDWMHREYDKDGNLDDDAHKYNDKYWKDLNDYGDKMKYAIKNNKKPVAESNIKTNIKERLFMDICNEFGTIKQYLEHSGYNNYDESTLNYILKCLYTVHTTLYKNTPNPKFEGWR